MATDEKPNQTEVRLEGRRIFINCFGQSVVRLTWEDEEGAVVTAQLFVADVRATKLTADRALRMLNYIEKNLSSVLSACFSRSDVSAGGNADNKKTTIWGRLALVHKCLTELEHIAPRFRWRRVARVLPSPTLVSTDRDYAAGERTVFWLLDNLDVLSRSTSANPAALRIHGRYLEATRVLSDDLAEDADVYENRILVGLCEALLEELLELRRTLDQLLDPIPEKDPSPSHSGEYVSFSTVGQTFVNVIRGRAERQLRDLERSAIILKREFEEAVPVSFGLREAPQLSPGFQRFTHYRRAFEIASEWYGAGSASFEAEAFLLGIRSLDVLFEFYCLVRLVKVFQALGYDLLASEFSSVGQESRFGEERPADEYSFRHRTEGHLLRLFYTPSIRPSGHKSGLRDIRHRGSGKDSRWTPDFLIQVGDSPASRFFILDAKYQHRDRAEAQLSEMTLKYIHGIGRMSSREQAVEGLFLMYAGGRSGSTALEDYHSPNYGVLGPNRVSPNVGVVQVAPGRADMLGRLVEALVSRCVPYSTAPSGDATLVGHRRG